MRYINKKNPDYHSLVHYTLNELIAALQDIQKKHGDIRVEGDLADWNTYASGLDLVVFHSHFDGEETMMELSPFVLGANYEGEDETEWETVQ